MELDKEKHARALKKAQQIIEQSYQKTNKVQVFDGADDFKAGNFRYIDSEDGVKSLSKYLLSLINEENYQELQSFFKVLQRGAIHEQDGVREASMKVVSHTVSGIDRESDPIILDMIVKTQIQWLKQETECFASLGMICKQVQETGLVFLEKRLWKDGRQLFSTIFKIQIDIYEKPEKFKETVVMLQDNLASKETLELLVGSYLSKNNPLAKEAEDLLVYLGRRAVIFCLNLLMRSEDKEERIALIKLLPNARSIGVPIMIDCLEKNPPWYVIRNIIFIISEIGDSSLYSIIRPYASSKDIRVQQQVVSCIAKFGGARMKSRLIENLPVVHDELKIQMVMQLGQMEGEEVEHALIDLLEKRHRFTPRVYESLARTICIALKNYPSEKVLEAVSEFVEELQKLDPVKYEAMINIGMDTLSIIKPKLRHIQKTVNTDLDFVSFDDDPVDEHTRTNNVRQVEERAYEVAGNDDLEEACNFLVNQIRILARDKDFSSAEYLRDKLLEINPMALNEVISVGEFIEEQKNSSIATGHIEVWNELYETMSTEQFNAIYYAMSLENYAAGEDIVISGETDPSLYFINSGAVNLNCKIDDGEMFLKRLQPGEIVGVNAFFSVTVWTFSLTAHSETQISVLHRDAFNELRDEYAGLEEKLERYCQKYNVVPDLVKMAGSDRRQFPRYSVSVIVSSMLLDPYGNPGKRSFKGELIDISRGGLCFTISISSKGNARMLLGRKIVCQIKAGKNEPVEIAGVIVGVKYMENMVSDFSIHIRYHTLLSESSITKVVNLQI